MKKLLYVLLLVSTTSAAGLDDFQHMPLTWTSVVPLGVAAENQTFGRNWIDAEVIFSTERWSLDTCSTRTNEDSKGFHVAKRADNGKLILYCGQGTIGYKYEVLKDEGI